jgi:hypothetical protein
MLVATQTQLKTFDWKSVARQWKFRKNQADTDLL